jgi:hypothetical protein
MELYKTGDWKELIEIVNPTKVSKTSVWIYNRSKEKLERKKRFGSYVQYFDTLKEAKCYLKNRLDKRLKNHQLEICKLMVDLDELEEFKPSVTMWGFLRYKCPIGVKRRNSFKYCCCGKKKRGRPRKIKNYG